MSLDREVGHADVRAVAGVTQRAVDHRERAPAAKVPHVIGHSQRQVNGLVRAEILSGAMVIARV